MPIETAEDLIHALRASALFEPEQLRAIERDLLARGADATALMRHILDREWLSHYQLRKVLHGKAAELRVGPYLVTDKVGEGGMGKVYRAQHTRNRRVFALKVVRPILLSNPVIRRRYDREVATALSLKHPNIVEVFEAGESDGRYYLAMEFVDGVDLSRLVKECRALEVVEACEYIRQAALGLHHAHEAGFVHRDIKPSNILVAGERHLPRASEPAVAKILDMGLMRAVDMDSDGDRNDLTRAGTVVGTPDYMAPEQAKNSRTVDRRADLYGLGCTLYYMLVGRPPFPDGSAIEKIIKHQVDAPPPLQALRRDVPGAVAEVVARLMAKDPANRFPTALAAAEALAPLACYAPGAKRTPIRLRESHPSPAPETVTAEQTDAPVPMAEPVSPSDRTPRPDGPSGPLHATVEVSPFASLNDPPSGVLPPAALTNPIQLRRKASKRKRWGLVLILAGVLLAAAIAGVWLVRSLSGKKPAGSATPNSQSKR